jgi:hypothetical protein
MVNSVMAGKLIGPIRREKARIHVSFGEKEVLLEKMYDPSDQLELLAKSILGKKLSLLALQLRMMGSVEVEAEGLARKLVSLERFNLIDLTRFLDVVSQRVGRLTEPVVVIGAIAENVTRFQNDPNRAVIAAGLLMERFASLRDPEEEKKFAAALKGN